jgi:hypothetical protein
MCPAHLIGSRLSSIQRVFAFAFCLVSVASTVGCVGIARQLPFTFTAAPTTAASTAPPTQSAPPTPTPQPPQVSISTLSLNFGDVNLGAVNTLQVTFANTGSVNVQLSQQAVNGSGFSATGIGSSLTLTANQSATLNVTFAPPSAGNTTGSVVLSSNASSSPIVIGLAGAGVAIPPPPQPPPPPPPQAPEVSISTLSLNFGNVNLGAVNTLQVTFANTGSTDVLLSQQTVSGSGFSSTGIGSSLTLPANQSATLNVTFAPSSAGNTTGSVVLSSNTSSSPIVIALAGAGVQPVFSVTLNWNPSTSPVVGYLVFRGPSSGGPWTSLMASAEAVLTYTDSTVQAGQVYFYAVSSVDSNNDQSTLAGPVSVQIPSP